MGLIFFINHSTWGKESMVVHAEMLMKELKHFGMVTLSWILTSLESYISI